MVDRDGVDLAILARMSALLQHRGPDEGGMVRLDAGRVGLAHRRLIIRDAAGGAQPMRSSVGDVYITFNGEIYDCEVLRATLSEWGYPFHSRSDTEVLLAAYVRWGVECVHHLLGEFAFVIWDGRDGSLFAARDPAGVKPLFYHETARGIAIASEAKAILSVPGAPRAISKDYLCGPFLGVYGGDVCAFEGVHAVTPGGWLRVDAAGRTQVGRWWPLTPSEVDDVAFDAAAEVVRNEVSLAVERRMSSDVDVHVYLSGGIDSAVIARQLRERSSRVMAFTVGFDEPGLDETRRAAAVASALSIPFHPIRVGTEALVDDVERAVWHTELAFGNPNTMARLALSRFAASHGVKVCLTGEGADEVFCGYPYFKLEALWRRWEGGASDAPRLWRQFQDLERTSKGLGWYPGLDWRRAPRTFGFACFNELRALRVRGLHRWLIRPDRWGDDWTEDDDPAARFYTAYSADRLARLDPIQVSREIAQDQLSGYLIPNLGDRVEMAYSIEGRTPFLDQRLRRAVDRLPAGFHLDVATLREKRLLHAAFDDVVPLVADARKHPFLAPGWSVVAATPRGRELFETWLSPWSLEMTGLFQVRTIRALFALWKTLPRGLLLRAQLDIVMGSVLCAQILAHQFTSANLPTHHGARA